MPIDKELLDILACPKCKGNLTLTKSQDGLICDACALKYHIKDDIPIMLIDKAEKIEVKKAATTRTTATKPAAKAPTNKKTGVKKTGSAKKKTKTKE